MSQDDGRPPLSEGTVQVAVFPERPNCLLLILPEATRGTLALPALSAPFTKAEVAQALSVAGLRAKVFETAPGRWTAAMNKARSDARAERAEKQRRAELVQAAILNGSNVEAIRERADAIRRKNEVDESLAALKVKFGRARAEAATRGKYMDVGAYRDLESRIERLKAESQALQMRLGQLREAEKETNRRQHTAENDAFRRAAHRRLDPDTFAAIEADAEGEDP